MNDPILARALRRCESEYEREATRMLHEYALLGEQQLRFHAERAWRFDFAWPNERVAVEIDGGRHMVVVGSDGRRHVGGSHNTSDDLHRQNVAIIAGWRVLRLTPRLLRRIEPCGRPYLIVVLWACGVRSERSTTPWVDFWKGGSNDNGIEA